MKYLFILVIFLITGCGATPYQSSGLTGGYRDFYSEDENTFNVSFSGNGQTKSNVASDYVLLRSAFLTKEKGYEFFEILDKSITITKVNVGTGANNIYSFKPKAWMKIKMIHSNDLITNRINNAEELITELTTKYNILVK